jgi:hypothetical protein
MQADAFNRLRDVRAVVDHELTFAGYSELELASQVYQLTGGQIVVPQLHEVDTTGDGVLYEFNDVSVLGVSLANDETEHGRP